MTQPLSEWAGLQILAELGRGTTGVVYRAEDGCMNRVVALKVPLLDVNTAEAIQRTRFLYEARALASMDGLTPHLPVIHSVGEHEGEPYYLREFVEGQTLEHLVNSGLIGPMGAARIVGTIAGVVGLVHSRGLVHRNLSPANVLVATDGTPKLIGFGRVCGGEQPLPATQGTSPLADVQALQWMLDWAFTALAQPMPASLVPARERGSVASAAELASLIAEGVRV